MGERLEIWAGVECTRNRVGDQFFDQLQATGHDQRSGDLQRIAALGATAVRYPVLWERVEASGEPDWRWTDERLHTLRDLRLRPIAGFVHHGSGPVDTNLLDPQFAPRLADFAARVAERYPWLQDFTPVNEPLTTARFSGLYGHWYPHARNDAAFVRALLNQCRAVVLSMHAIRSVSPRARLVQTDDLGQTSSTPKLRYQADFENERRWLAFDLLCGRVDRNHALWNYLIDLGNATEQELEWFVDNACPPNIVGVNYYLTSERFLHEKVERFPAHVIGGNGRQAYADVETARVREEGLVGPESILLQTWTRYKLPIAVTECHNGCTREEQLRWVLEVWRGCEAARAKGADVRALTAWSLFGAVDWDSLVTAQRNHYEPGVYDIRSPQPRPTALAKLFRALANGENVSHPLTDAPGWWKRPERLVHGIVEADPHAPIPIHRTSRSEIRPLLVLGAEQALGERLLHDCRTRGITANAVKTEEGDGSAFSPTMQPWAILDCRAENAKLDNSAHLALFCMQQDVRLVTFSTHAVFDGRKPRPYVESDSLHSVSRLGRDLSRMEQSLLSNLPSALILRTGPLFGADGEDFLSRALYDLHDQRRVELDDAEHISPTYLPDLAHCALDLLTDEATGIWHLANEGATTTLDFVRNSAESLGLSTANLVVDSQKQLERNFAISSERAWIMPSLQSALTRYCETRIGSFPLEEAA